jgi:thiol-disulfide isomerase/thioredoxin
MIQFLRDKFQELTKMQLIAIVCVLVIIGCKVLHLCCSKTETFTNHSGNNPAVFRMFHVTWCGHCKEAKPKFMEFIKNNPDINTEMIDAEDTANADVVAAHDIDGYPTFILTKNGTDIVYKGERTEAGFKAFMDENK